MSRPLLPPRGVFIATHVLLNPSFSAPVRETLLHLMMLAWGSKTHVTPALSMPELARITHKSVRTIYGHLAVLRADHAALRLQSAGNGLYIIALADWLYEETAEGGPLCKTLQTPDQEEESIKPIHPLKQNHPPDDQRARVRNARVRTARLPIRVRRAPPEGLSGALQAELADAGVFPRLLPEVAQSGYAEDELRALLAWAAADRPGNAAAVFMGRLRSRAQPPPEYFVPPCPRCGRHGGHHPECPARYKTGLYASYLEGA